jgi:chitinase
MTTFADNISLSLSGRVLSGNSGSRPALIGYWHNWHSDEAEFVRLRDVSPAFDVINIAFGLADTAKNGTVVFEPCEQTSAAELKADIAALQSCGRKVVLSVGGANGSFALDTQPCAARFRASLEKLLDEYRFDGLDIDLEGTLKLEAGDDDFGHPVSPAVVHLIGLLRELKEQRGPGFLLSLAPQVAYVQGGFRAYRDVQGSYLPLIEHLRDCLDYVHVQHYNALPQKALDGRFYDPDDPDFHLAMAEMLLLGFPVAGGVERFFAGLRPEQVSIGLPSLGRIVQNGYLGPDTLGQAMAYLVAGGQPLRRYQLQRETGYPGFGALMTWSINWDRAAGYEFSQAARLGLDLLPG